MTSQDTAASGEGRPKSVLRSAAGRGLRERVVGILVDAIRDGAYSDGDRLPSERELADQIGVSRTIVSDAIDQLAESGVLESRRGRNGGTFVISVSKLPVRQQRVPGERRQVMAWLLEARYTVEIAVVALAANRAHISDLREMRNLYDEMARLVDQPRAYAEAGMRLNLRIAAASRNPFLMDFVRQLVNEQATLRHEFTDDPTPDELRTVSLATYSELLAAMLAGDSTRMSAAVAAHIDGVRRIYLDEQAGDDADLDAALAYLAEDIADR